MLLSAVSVLVVAQSKSLIPEGLMNNRVCACVWACACMRLVSLVNVFGRVRLLVRASLNCVPLSPHPVAMHVMSHIPSRAARRFFQPHTVEYDLVLTRVNNNLVLRRNGSCAGPLTIFSRALVNIVSVWDSFYSPRSFLSL